MTCLSFLVKWKPTCYTTISINRTSIPSVVLDFRQFQISIVENAPASIPTKVRNYGESIFFGVHFGLYGQTRDVTVKGGHPSAIEGK